MSDQEKTIIKYINGNLEGFQISDVDGKIICGYGKLTSDGFEEPLPDYLIQQIFGTTDAKQFFQNGWPKIKDKKEHRLDLIIYFLYSLSTVLKFNVKNYCKTNFKLNDKETQAIIVALEDVNL